MGRITKFTGLNGKTYTFPTVPGDQDYRDNFKEVRGSVSRIPGASGGVDEHGIGRAPTATGNVQFSIYMLSTDRNGMDALRDAIAEMVDWGWGRLFYQPTNPAAAERFCWGRVNNIDDPEQRHKNTDLWQPVRLSFQVPDPYWYTRGNEFLWDDGNLWDASGLTWDGTGALNSITNSGEFTVTYNGSAYTVANILLLKDTSGTANYFKIQRIVNQQIKDEVRWDGALFNGQYLLFDARAHKVMNVGGETTRILLTTKYADWMRLLPGDNTIRVLCEGSVKVGLRYLERYR